MSITSKGALLSTLLALPFFACDCGGETMTPTCMTDTDCREGERCVMGETMLECRVGIECVADEECGDPRRACDLATFTCGFIEPFADECDPTRPCPFGQFCSQLLGRCLDAGAARDCTRRAQCPTGQICDQSANKCIPDPGCYGDDFCEDGEVCDLVNRVCRSVAVECVSCALTQSCESSIALCMVDTFECLGNGEEAACQQGETCDPLGRCVQCRSSADCGPGLFCNVALGRCESNVQCADNIDLCPQSPEVTCVTCDLPEVCDPRTRRCQAPPTICENDVDCPNEQLCDLSVDPPICVPRVPDCLNDLFDEPAEGPPTRNDNSATATFLSDEAGPLFNELKLCPGDQDWYRIEVPAGTFLTVDARFLQDDGDIELQLFLEDGQTLLDESRSVTNNERVELDAGTDQVLMLRVFLAIPTVRQVPYRLVISKDEGTLCDDDDNEPDDGASQAKQLLSDTPYEGRLCTGDPDWFVLRNVTPGTRITADLDFVDSLGDLDFELYRAGARTPFLISNTTTDDESLVFDASYGGDYFLRVVGKDSDQNVYTIRVNLRENAVPTCLDDFFESNDTLDAPTSTVATYANPLSLSLCSGDEDWFLINLPQGAALRADIGFDPSSDLELRLYDADITDPNTQPLKESISTFPRESLGFRSFLSSDYLLRVSGFNAQDSTPYELRMQVDPPLFCEPDMIDTLARGDDQMDPFLLPLPPTRMDDLSLCNLDDGTPDPDWFRSFVQVGFSNIFRLQYLEDDADLDFELFDFNGNMIFSTVGQPMTGLKLALINVPGAGGFGIVDVHVIRTGGGEANYSLVHDLVPVFNCQDDRAEANNNLIQASTLTATTSSPIELDELTLCASVRGLGDLGDEDWFQLTPPAVGAQIRADIDFAQGDLLLELLAPGGSNRACLNLGPDRCFSDGSDLNEFITFTATTTEPYLLRVSSVYSSPNVPVRPTDIDTNYDLKIEYTLPP